MDAARARKLADRISQIVAEMLERRIKDPRLGFVTVTEARLTNDLREATVFYTVYGSDAERADTAAALHSATGIIRSEVGRQLGLRHTPSLEFVADVLPENAPADRGTGHGGPGDDAGGWLTRRRTLLIDSEQLDSGEALSDDFRSIAASEIEAFKKELRLRGDPRDVDKLTDADILREVMNTVGRAGKLGADIRCVVSVSMLTEGWDANTVTHIMGVRAFGTQLLCEQVVGRGLRRISYEIDPATGLFPVEYADVLGVPFTFAQQGKKVAPRPPPKVTRVRAIKERAALEIRFPNVVGYRVVFPRKPLRPTFTHDSEMPLNTDDIPVRTEIEPLIGEGFTIDLRRNADQLREKTVIFDVAGLPLRTYFIDEDGALQVWRYPELVRITERWFKECLKCSGGTLPQFLKWRSLAIRAVEKIYRSLAPSLSGPPDASDGALMPILNAYNPEGTTKYVDFPTTKTTLFVDAAGPAPPQLRVYDATLPPLPSGRETGVRATDRGRGSAPWRPSRMSSRAASASPRRSTRTSYGRACAARGFAAPSSSVRFLSIAMSSISTAMPRASRSKSMARSMAGARSTTQTARRRSKAPAFTSSASPTTKSATISTTCCAKSARSCVCRLRNPHP